MLLKKTQKSALSAMALSALLMTALAGCQKTEAPAAPEAQPPAQEAPAPTEAPAPAAPEAQAPAAETPAPAEQPKS